MTPQFDRRTFLKGLGVVTVAAACGGAATAPSAAPATSAAVATATATAKPTGRISVYSALNESTNNEFVKAFKAAVTGVEVDLLPLAAAGELQTRIRAEKASPKADIFIGGDSSFHDGLGKEGLLEAYTSPNASAIAKEAKDPAGNWTGFYFGIFGIITNTDRFTKEIGGAKPTSWDDLLDAKYKGKLVLGSPITTGGGYIFIATQIFRFNKDEAKAMDFMKKFHANVAQYPGTSPQAIQLVSQGQFVGAPNWSHDILTEKAKNPGIDLSVPKGTGYEIGAVSIIKGTKNPQAAQAFVDWTLTKEAGELNVKLSNRVSVRSDVAPAPGAPTLTSVEMVNYDRDWAAANKDRVLKLWQTTVGL
jgi:iron(III) transport system substrate-binding protein